MKLLPKTDASPQVIIVATFTPAILLRLGPVRTRWRDAYKCNGSNHGNWVKLPLNEGAV